MESKIYRVTVKTTSSLQPMSTHWNREVVYCGTDRTEARIEFHSNTSSDFCRGHGNSSRNTVMEIITDVESDDFYEDLITTDV